MNGWNHCWSLGMDKQLFIHTVVKVDPCYEMGTFVDSAIALAVTICLTSWQRLLIVTRMTLLILDTALVITSGNPFSWPLPLPDDNRPVKSTIQRHAPQISHCIYVLPEPICDMGGSTSLVLLGIYLLFSKHVISLLRNICRWSRPIKAF